MLFDEVSLGDRVFGGLGCKKQVPLKNQCEQEMRVVVSNLIPRFEKLCSAQQAHTPLVSHCDYK